MVPECCISKICGKTSVSGSDNMAYFRPTLLSRTILYKMYEKNLYIFDVTWYIQYITITYIYINTYTQIKIMIVTKCSIHSLNNNMGVLKIESVS